MTKRCFYCGKLIPMDSMPKTKEGEVLGLYVCSYCAKSNGYTDELKV